MEIQTYKDNIREYTQHSTTNNNVIISTILDKTTNEGTLAENALRHGPRQEVDI